MSTPQLNTDAAAADPVVDAPVVDAAPDAAVSQDPAAGDEGSADADAGDSSILGDAATSGDGDDGDKDGSADDAKEASDDAPKADAEPAAPYADLAPPDGFESIDAAALEAATPLMREFGVPDDRAQDFINQAAPVITGMIERAVNAGAEQAQQNRAELIRGWADEVQNDPTYGGANLGRTQAEAARVMDALFPDTFRSFLKETGLGNHPDMVRGMARVAQVTQEGDFITEGGAPKVELKTHQKLYDPVYDGPQKTT